MTLSAGKRRTGYSAVLMALGLLTWSVFLPDPARAGCSSYIGRAVINEIRSGPLTFLEVKILDPSITSAVFNTWSLMVCNSREGCSGPHSLSTFTNSDPYYTTSVVPEVYINLSTTGSRAGTDFLLTDAAGDAIDYVSVAGFTMQQVVCAYPFDTAFPGGNSFEAARLPDGTGNWSDLDSGGNSVPPTPGDTNDDPLGVLPRLQTASVTIYEGGTANFVVTLVDSNGNPTTAGSDITVQFSTEDGTATVADGDYTANSGVLTIPAGAGSGTIQVDTLMDAVDDDGEYFYIFLPNAVNASVINNYALATITATLPAIDHFRIDNPGTGLTCQPAPVTITACEDVGCISTYTGDVDITLSPAGWVGGDTQTLSGGTGTFYLRHNTSGTVTLGVTSTAPAPFGAGQCYEGGSPGSCNLQFFDTGFVFDVPDLTSCQPSGNVTISAVRLDDTTQACVAAGGFAGQTKSVNFWSNYINPGGGSIPVEVNSAPVAGSAPGTGVALSFNSNAQSTFSVSYNDAGQIQLFAQYIGTGDEAGLVMNGNDTFVASPDHLIVVATTDGTTLLNNPTDSGNPLFPAGRNFFLQVSAVCPDGVTVTPNFAWNTVVSPSPTDPYRPTGGTLGNLNNGNFTSAEFSAGAGSATHNTVQYTEVGTVTLQAVATNYLGAGSLTGTSGIVGRFTPDHFTVANNVPRFRTGCDTGGFTYVGQFFDFETQPVLAVTAENALGDITSNYTNLIDGNWFKITNATLTGKSYATASGTLDDSRIPAPDPAIADLGNGMADLTFSVGSLAADEGVAFVRSDPPVAPFDAEISLQINVADADGIVFPGNPAQFGAPTPGSGILFDNGKEMRWGRLVLQNAFGPEILPLAVPLQTEYYNSVDIGFVLNTADGCTTLSAADLWLVSEADPGPVPGNNPIQVNPATSNTTSATIANQPMISGDAGLSLAAPSEGGDGWVDLTIDLSPTGLDWPWLQFDWNESASPPVHDENPSARATFGIFKGNPHLLYRRQTFR